MKIAVYTVATFHAGKLTTDVFATAAEGVARVKAFDAARGPNDRWAGSIVEVEVADPEIAVIVEGGVVQGARNMSPDRPAPGAVYVFDLDVEGGDEPTVIIRDGEDRTAAFLGQVEVTPWNHPNDTPRDFELGGWQVGSSRGGANEGALVWHFFDGERRHYGFDDEEAACAAASAALKQRNGAVDEAAREAEDDA
jgi:hypothetical protein